jgi:transposase-like protein
MKKFSKEEKAMWLEDWQQSGKNAWAYAKENGLVPQTFTSWTRPRKKEAKQIFMEIPKKTLQSTRLMMADRLEILIEKGDIRIHIPLEPVLKELHTVITKLGQAI